MLNNANYLTPRANPYVRALLQNARSANNGTTAGGLASVLGNLGAGMVQSQDRMAAEKDRADQLAAQKAFMQGMTPTGNPNMGPGQQPGSLTKAATLLAGMGDNPYAGQMGQQVAMMQAQQSAADQRAEQARVLDERRRDEERRYAEQQAGNKLVEVYDPTTQTMKLVKASSAEGMLAGAPGSGVSGQDPAAVQEWKYYASLSPEDQARYLTMKRATKWLDLGYAQVAPNPANPTEVSAEQPVGIAPERSVVDGQVVTMPAVVPGDEFNFGDTGLFEAGGMPGTEQAGQGGVSSVSLPPTPAELAAEAKAEENKSRAADVVLTDIDRALGLLDNDAWYNPVAGMGSGTAAMVPGSDATDFAALVKTVRGNIGFDRLQQMRDASPTGGALGAINETELATLQSVLGNLEQSQSVEQLRYNMNRLKNVYLDIVHGPGNGPERVNLSNTGAQHSSKYNVETLPNGRKRVTLGAPDPAAGINSAGGF